MENGEQRKPGEIKIPTNAEKSSQEKVIKNAESNIHLFLQSQGKDKVSETHPESNVGANKKPLTEKDVYESKIHYEIRGAESIARLLEITTTNLQNGIRFESGNTLNANDLQLKILHGIMKTPEEIEAIETTDKIGFQTKINELAAIHPLRSRLDWLLLDVAKSTQQASAEGKKEILWNENKSIGDLSMMMTSEQREQEKVDSKAITSMNYADPLKVVKQLLEKGREQKIIGKDAYNLTPEYKMAEELGKRASKLRDELEDKNVVGRPIIDLERLEEDKIEIINAGIRFEGTDTTLTFDPRQLALGILVSDIEPLSSQKVALGETEEIVHAYYPHYRDNKLATKTELVMPLRDASYLLKRCFKEIGFSEKAAGVSLDTYRRVATLYPRDEELHRYSGAYSLRKTLVENIN